MDVYVIPAGRRRGQAADDPLGRRHRPRLDARRQGNPLRQPARRRFHGQALRRLDRRRPAPRRRPRHGGRRLLSPDGTKLAVNRKAQAYWRKYYRGAYQSDVTVMDLATKTFKDLTSFDGMDSWPLWSQDGFIYFVSDREGKGLTNIWRVAESGGEAEQVTDFTSGDVRFPGDQRRRQDDRLRARFRHLEARPRQPGGQADPARDRRRDPGDA